MAALELQYMTILKKVLADRFVPFLPPLLDAKKPAADQIAKQLSRAFSAFALHKILDLLPQVAASAGLLPQPGPRCVLLRRLDGKTLRAGRRPCGSAATQYSQHSGCLPTKAPDRLSGEPRAATMRAML